MIKKVGSNKHPDIFPISTPSPISFCSKNFSPIQNQSRDSKIAKSKYKSPNSSPISSPLPLKKSNGDQLSQCLSEKKIIKSTELINKLNHKLLIREKRINLLEEENKKLNSLKTSETWGKELAKRNEDIRKLENQLKYYKLCEIIEKQNKKISELEIIIKENHKQRCEDHDAIIKDLKNDNVKLISTLAMHDTCLKRDECEILHRQIQELELNLERHTKENIGLKEEIKKYSQALPLGSLVYFIQDVGKIKKEVGKLLAIAEDLRLGQDITIKGLLGIEHEKVQDPAVQLSNDIFCIKRDLNKIFIMISDFHAAECATNICRNQ